MFRFLASLFAPAASQAPVMIERIANTIRPNPENQAIREAEKAARDAKYGEQALAQYASEFNRSLVNRTWFDSLTDGINRLVRPVMALSVFAIPGAVMMDDRVAVRVENLAQLPNGYWAIASAIIAFYFAGRMQLKSHDFKRNGGK